MVRGLRASAFLLQGFHLVEQGVQALEPALPELAVVLQPFGGFCERFGLQPAGPPLRVVASRNQPGTLQHFEVFGNRRLGHGERLSQLGHRCFTRGKPGQDRPPGGIGERCERHIKTIGIHIVQNHYVI